MTYAMPPQPAKKGKPWTLIIGGIVALIALLLCCGGGVPTVSWASDLMEAPERNGSHSVTLDEGESVAVWVEAGTGTTCSATGPGGPVSSEGISEQTMNVNERELEREMSFEAEESGSYTITCSDTFVVGDDLPVGGAAVMAIGGAFCCLSSILIIVGGILWLTKRKG